MPQIPGISSQSLWLQSPHPFAALTAEETPGNGKATSWSCPGVRWHQGKSQIGVDAARAPTGPGKTIPWQCNPQLAPKSSSSRAGNPLQHNKCHFLSFAHSLEGTKDLWGIVCSNSRFSVDCRGINLAKSNVEPWEGWEFVEHSAFPPHRLGFSLFLLPFSLPCSYQNCISREQCWGQLWDTCAP